MSLMTVSLTAEQVVVLARTYSFTRNFIANQTMQPLDHLVLFNFQFAQKSHDSFYDLTLHYQNSRSLAALRKHFLRHDYPQQSQVKVPNYNKVELHRFTVNAVVIMRYDVVRLTCFCPDIFSVLGKVTYHGVFGLEYTCPHSPADVVKAD